MIAFDEIKFKKRLVLYVLFHVCLWNPENDVIATIS